MAHPHLIALRTCSEQSSLTTPIIFFSFGIRSTFWICFGIGLPTTIASCGPLRLGHSQPPTLNYSGPAGGWLGRAGSVSGPSPRPASKRSACGLADSKRRWLGPAESLSASGGLPSRRDARGPGRGSSAADPFQASPLPLVNAPDSEESERNSE